MFDPVDPSEIDIFGTEPTNDNFAPSAMAPPAPSESDLRAQKEKESLAHAARVKSVFLQRRTGKFRP